MSNDHSVSMLTVWPRRSGCRWHGRQVAQIVGTIGTDNHGMICRVCKARGKDGR